MRKNALQLTLPVLVVCAVASGGLAMTYAVTKDRIVQQEKAAEEASLREVLPKADTFTPMKGAELEAAVKAGGPDAAVSQVYRCEAAGELVGWGVKAGPRGYGGPITLVVGVDRDGKVTGISIISMNETPGLGSKVVDEPGFMKQFVGLASATADKDVKSLDMITGATKSSRGIRKGVLGAAHVYEALAKDGGES